VIPELPGLADPLFHTDPYAAFAWLREERPVSQGRYYDGTPIWLVTAYEDVRFVLSDRRFVHDASRQSQIDVSATFGIPAALRPFFERHLLAVDPPDHTRLRRLIAPAFTAARVAALRPWILQTTDQLLDQLDQVEGKGVVDLVDRFAHPLPIAVIAELMGVPVEDRERWREWTKGLAQADADPAAQQAQFADGAQGMVDFAWRTIEAKRTCPGDDLTSALVRAGENGLLDDDELVAMVVGLLGAGYRTTSRFLANGTFALLTNPEQLALLRRQPSLLPTAIEELVRFLTPLETAPALRFATEPVDVGGVTIPAGSVVQVVLGSANRDPHRFPDADRLQIDRADNGHVAFGHGLHFCPGAGLARLEAEIAFAGLLSRFPALALAVPPDEVEWYPSFSRGPVRLPVRLR
jgi:cytochrome P450